MSANDIERVYVDQSARLAHSLAHKVLHDNATGRPVELEHLLLLAAGSGFSCGLEVGLAIAINDIVAGRVLQRWFLDEVTHGDSFDRDSLTQPFLEVLK